MTHESLVRWAVAALACVMVGCAAVRPGAPAPVRTAIPETPRSEVPGAPVARQALPPGTTPPGAAITPLAPVPSTAAAAPIVPSVVVPPGTLYVCLTQEGGTRKETAIEFAPQVAALCRKHPEMGPCQYERDLCRRAHGRVFAADGREITLATEAEYDKHVLRVRFRSD